MRYRIGKDIVIRSENAAKPEAQSSSYLNKLIAQLQPVHSSFDFGCGKLRYERVIAKTTDELAFVNSEVQLSRTQMIRGRSTTIRDHARKSNHVQAYTVNQFASLGRKYDRGFCINVLSVIPLRERQAGHRPVDENQTEAKLLLPVRISLPQLRLHTNAEAS